MTEDNIEDVINNMIEDEIWKELNQAETFRAEGQHGKARVMARRALGKACQSLLNTQDRWHPGMSALDCISELRCSNLTRPAWVPLLSHFLLHVDEDHNLPGEVDLVDEAATLISDITKLMRSSRDGEN